MRIYSDHWKDYELIDAGGDKKLERWGEIVTIRPERNAYFSPVMSEKEWYEKADFEFLEKQKAWKKLSDKPNEWQLAYKNLTFNLKLTKFKHTGIFPEQRTNWDFLEEALKEGDRFLNLFGYTGAASLVARSQGADVFHCDSVKQIIGWGKENMEASGLSDIHWVLEDAMKFAEREVRRERTYKGIIMDPPAFGLGAKGERWKIEEKIEDLIRLASDLLDNGGFLILNTYTPKLEMDDLMKVSQQYFDPKDVNLNILCMNTKSGKRIEYGLRALIHKN